MTYPSEIEFNIRGPLICASAEAESRTYTLHIAKSGRRYLVANQPNAADNIYVEGGPDSRGFAGRTISFTLTDESVLELTGPQHTNPNDFLSATGIDIRNKHLTRGIVALSRTHKPNSWTNIYNNILHYDPEPVVGTFDRIRVLAQDFANELNQMVFYEVRASGGGSSGSVKPNHEGGQS